MRQKLFTLLFTLLLTGWFSLTVQADQIHVAQIRVAVAANFKPVLQTLAAEFEKETQHKISISSASTGVLYNQITNGAPFDLFLSADSRRPVELEKDGLTIKGSRQTYAYGELVLWNTSKRKLSLEGLKSYQGRLAIANPATAPYGLAAQEVLQGLSLWGNYQGRIVQGASIQQAWQFVASGNIKVGLVAHSQLVGDQYKDADIILIPTDLYAPIQQEMVILKRSKEPALAKKFSDYLMSEASQNYIASQGYKIAKN